MMDGNEWQFIFFEKQLCEFDAFPEAWLESGPHGQADGVNVRPASIHLLDAVTHRINQIVVMQILSHVRYDTAAESIAVIFVVGEAQFLMDGPLIVFTLGKYFAVCGHNTNRRIVTARFNTNHSRVRAVPQLSPA